LDRAHENAITALSAAPRNGGDWDIKIFGRGDLGHAVWGAERKAELFRTVFGVAVRFLPREARRPEPPSS
jgi:hypothetical protein